MSKNSNEKKGLPQRVKMRHDSHFVNEFAGRHTESIGEMVHIDRIVADPNQPRSSMGDLDELAASIQDKGILEPILARPISMNRGEGAQDLMIISGERRYRAALELGLREVPVIVMEVSEQEALEIALIENLQRKDLTPFEEAEGYKALAELHGYTQEQISRGVGKSRSLIAETMRLLEMSPRVRDVSQALGISSRSILLEVVRRGGSDSDMVSRLEEVARFGLNRDELRRRRSAEDKPKVGSSSRRTRRRPYVFNFRPTDKSYRVSLAFKKSVVEKEDLIVALESVIAELRSSPDLPL